MEREGEPTWQPISALGLIATMIDSQLAGAQDQHHTLLAARPYVLDDATVERLLQAYGATRDDLWLYDTQLDRWDAEALTTGQRQEVGRLRAQMADLREVVGQILALGAHLKGETIEALLAKSDLAVGAEWLPRATKARTPMRPFAPMTIEHLAAHVAEESDADRRWLLLLEFLEEHDHEPTATRRSLVEAEPALVGDERWDALLAGVAEWLAVRDGLTAPPWVHAPHRTLSDAWCPHALASLQRLASDNAPPEIRRHGVLIDPYDLARA